MQKYRFANGIVSVFPLAAVVQGDAGAAIGVVIAVAVAVSTSPDEVLLVMELRRPFKSTAIVDIDDTFELNFEVSVFLTAVLFFPGSYDTGT